MKIIYSLLLIVLLGNTVRAQQTFPSQMDSGPAQTGFLKNVGQVRDFENKPVDFIYYGADIGGQQVYITKYGLSILISRPKKIQKISAFKEGKMAKQEAVPADSLTIVNYEMERIDIVLKDASIKPGNIVTTAKNHSPGFNLYFDSYNTKGESIQLQNEVLIKNVYPGIDWKVYIKEGTKPYLKYDFIVHQGADPSLIKLRYSDNAKLKLSNSQINATVKMGQLTEDKPYSYLKGSMSAVNVSYQVKRNEISFKVPDYDKSSTLIIDPSIFWLTYLSSTNHVIRNLALFGNDVETDATGNIFVQQSASAGTPFPTRNPGGGAYYRDYAAAPNGAMIISKFAPGGQMLWSTYFGNGVGGRSMTVDKSGNIVAVGQTLGSSPDYPNPNPAIPLLDNGGFYDASRKSYFITKFSNSGILMWSSYYCSFSSSPMDLSYDNKGNVYVVGSSGVTDFPVVDPGGGAYVGTPQYNSAQTIFISQFDASNKLTWSTRIESNTDDPHARVCTDQAGNIYIGGHTRSGTYPLVNAGGYFDNSRQGSVITRFNAARKMTWSTYIPGDFQLYDVTTDDNNNFYVTVANKIYKFNINTELVWEKSVNTTRSHTWRRIHYDPVLGHLQLLGIMNDTYWQFPTINTPCKGTFFHDGFSRYNSATGPIFATMSTEGDFTYRSLVDWVSEYYQYFEMTTDLKGDAIYIFSHNTEGDNYPNPQLTDPGNGAYFDKICCAGNGGGSALLLKLTTSDISVKTKVTQPAGCNCDGTISATPTCGLAPFTYKWSNGATTASVTGLCPGIYWVKVTDANNLSKIIYDTILNPPGGIKSIATKIIPENCDKSNGSVSIHNVQGGTMPYTYSLDGVNFYPSSQFSGLDSGTHFIYVKDDNGCRYNDSIVVSRIPGPSSATYKLVPSSCLKDDGQLLITNVKGGIGPYNYSLNTLATNTTGVFADLPAANYQLIISDTAACGFTNTVVIGKAVPATDASFTISDDHCDQSLGSIKVNSVTGGTAPYTYSIDNISFVNGTINNLPAAEYTLLIKDSNGCVLNKGKVEVANVKGPSQIDFTKEDAVCGSFTGSLSINSVTGGTGSYSFSIDGQSYSSVRSYKNLAPGKHSITAKDFHGCSYTDSLVVDFLSSPVTGLRQKDTAICYDQEFVLNMYADRPDMIKSTQWNIPHQNESALIKVTADKLVILTVTDNSNCILKDSVLVRVKACNPPETCIAMPNAFTPNRDGKNDDVKPLVQGCRVKKFQMLIFNRYGELMFESNELSASWNGYYKGVLQSSGVYVYSCTYTGEDDIVRNLKGSITLVQ
jgi:gliding motility-associated-like protein